MNNFARAIGTVALIAVCLTGLELMRSTSLEGQLLFQQQSGSACSAPAGSTALCGRCYTSFCSTFAPDHVKQLCSSFCGAQQASTGFSAPAFSRTSVSFSLPYIPQRSSTSARFSSRAPSPVCGNNICEPTESQYCPRDCPGTVSSARSSAPSNNPLNITCNPPLPTGTDSCSTCIKYLCPTRGEADVITACTPTCQIQASRSSSAKSSSIGRSSTSSLQGEPGGSFIEIRTTNAQQFQTSGEGWIPYGVTRMHLNKIDPSGTQPTARWETQLPFGTYEIFMYWPHDRDASERYLMDSVPMFLTLNSSNHSFILNQRTAVPAFGETIGGAGPETVVHNWYKLGSFNASEQNGFELPQTMRLTMPTGRASDSMKNATEGWIAAGDIRIYYNKPGITCGDNKCHDSERETCAIDCEGVEQCGNGYCDLHLGESLQTCVQDCGASGICGNLRCEPYAGENINNCRSDCQTSVGTTGGDGGGDTGGTGTTGGDEGGTTGGNTGGETGGDDAGDTGGNGGEGGGDTGGGTSSAPAKCGNGIREGAEECDDANRDNTDYCTTKCTVPRCGDNGCQPSNDETYLTCSQDCASYCGDKICNATGGETEAGCPVDCGDDAVAYCGDARCNNGETYTSCPKDCANRCGDGICNPTPGINPGENATNCPADCSYCGDQYCAKHESWETCSKDCQRSSSSVKSSSKASSKASSKGTCSLVDTFGRTCTDSDCGINTAAAGTVTLSTVPGVPGGTFVDTCVGQNNVSEFHCMQNPPSVPLNGSTYYVGQVTAYCAYGCESGKCRQGPSGTSNDPITNPTVREPSDDSIMVEPDDVPETPDIIDIEVEFNEPPMPTAPSCGNANDAGFLCRICLTSFCPFGNDRANNLCSFYCSADASLSLTADVTDTSMDLPLSAVPVQPHISIRSFFVMILLLLGWM